MASTVVAWIDEICKVECPSCKAPPGEYCASSSDLWAAHSKGQSVHLVRWELYDQRCKEPLLMRKMREATRNETP